LKNKILCIEILKNDVYIEFQNGEIQYLSFSKAKKILFSNANKTTTPIKYFCTDSDRSVIFLNNLLNKYTIADDTLVSRLL